MAYMDVQSLHALPVNTEVKALEPAAILFPRGPEWSWRYMRNRQHDRLDDRFMYKDQGPPMYQLLGHHYNMYQVPPRTDYHSYSRSYHYEPRQYNAPSYRNTALTFPSGPPPAQIARFNDLLPVAPKEPSIKKISMPGVSAKSMKAWDKYRYLPGPPSDTVVYGRPQGWEALPKL